MNRGHFESIDYDYIVIGAGSTGCVVANRLSADLGNRVLLLEAGGSDRSVYIHMPAATYIKAIGNPKYDWMYPTEPDPTTGGRATTLSRGRVMGGSSSINGMIYIRGFPHDYDGWEARGNPGWGWKDVLPLFKRQEDNERGSSDYHGVGGPLSVSDIRELHPLAEIFMAAAQARNIPFNDDLNGPMLGGLGYAQATQRKGWRNSSARAFIDPVRQRPNLHVFTHATAQRLLFEGTKVVGVEILHKKQIKRFKVAREVVVCAGAIASPQVLLLSGIGEAGRLNELGIPVVANNPGVGRNFQDHPGINMTYTVTIPTFNDEMALCKQILHGANWLFRGRGPGSTPDAHIVGFIRSSPEEEIPDIQIHVTPAGYSLAGEGGELVMRESSFTIVVSVCRPKSTGFIDLRSADPREWPVIQHRLFNDHDDLERLARGVKLVREIVNTSPLKEIVGRPVDAVLHGANGEEFKEYVRTRARDIAHPSCTCRMGSDPAAVVSPTLKVNGVEGVRVADASVMPVVTSGNLNAPCMMIGEKAAELILSANHSATRPSALGAGLWKSGVVR